MSVAYTDKTLCAKHTEFGFTFDTSTLTKINLVVFFVLHNYILIRISNL